MPRVWTRGQIRWVLPSWTGPYPFHKEASRAEDTPVCFFEKKHHRCCMKVSCQASPWDPYSGRLISKIKCINSTVQRHSGQQRGPRRFWNEFLIEVQLSARASLKLWHCLGHDAHQTTRDTELVPGCLPILDLGQWLQIGNTLSVCRRHDSSFKTARPLDRRNLLVWPYERFSPGSSETLLRSKEEEKNEALFIRLPLNSSGALNSVTRSM